MIRYDPKELARKIREWRWDGVRFVREVFGVEPDEWQKDVLIAFCNGNIPKLRIAMQACVGPGKSCVMAWCGWHFLLCQGETGHHPKGAVVAVTKDNLGDNLWPEYSKWQQRSPILLDLFEWTKTRIYCKAHPNTWFLSARSFAKGADPETQGRTLSGLHSKYVMAQMDESGEIPPAVGKAAEQAMSERDCAFGRIMQAGNPTSLEGILYKAATELSHLWHIIRITGDPDDPKRSPRIDIEWAREQIATEGRDNPWIMSSILGLFPPSSINSLLGPDEIRAAMERHYAKDKYDFMQKRLGTDVARFGDDRTCLFPRQGLVAFAPTIMRNARTEAIAGRVMLARDRWNHELDLVDGTGGFGAGVIDALRVAGHTPIEVNFSGAAADIRYANLRAEMYFRLAKWVQGGGALPHSPELVKELSQQTYIFVNGKFQMESKEQIKKRLKFSPDLADALALTFALPEMPAARIMEGAGIRGKNANYVSEYDEADVDRIRS